MAKKKKSIQFPTGNAKFNTAFTQLMGHLAVADTDSGSTALSYVRLGLNTTTQYNPLLAILGTPTTANTWLMDYPLESHKATRNAILTQQIKTLKKNALKIIRPLRVTLRQQEKITPGFLTPADKQFFFIADTSPRTSTAATLRTAHPTPNLSMFSVKHLEHVVDATNPETPKSHSFPEGAIFLWLKIYIGTVEPTDHSQFTHLLFSPKFRMLSNVFPTVNINQTAWYTAAYIGADGKVSGWSPFVSSTITKTS